MWKLLSATLISILIGCSSTTTTTEITVQSPKGNLPPLKVEHIKWYELNYESLLLSKVENKNIVIFAFDESCSFCAEMAKQTFHDHRVVSLLNDQFIPVYLDVAQNPDILLGITHKLSVPTTIFIDPNGKPTGFVIGFIGPDDYLKLLSKQLEK